MAEQGEKAEKRGGWVLTAQGRRAVAERHARGPPPKAPQPHRAGCRRHGLSPQDMLVVCLCTPPLLCGGDCCEDREDVHEHNRRVRQFKKCDSGSED